MWHNYSLRNDLAFYFTILLQRPLGKIDGGGYCTVPEK